MVVRVTALLALAAGLVLLLLASCGSAYAHERPEERDRSGTFSPVFDFKDSPVNLIVCATKDACTFEGGPR